MFDTIRSVIEFFPTEKHGLPLITLPIVSTIPLKMAFQNTVEKKVKMLVTIFYMSNIVFFFFYLSKLYLVFNLQILSN